MELENRYIAKTLQGLESVPAVPRKGLCGGAGCGV